MPVNPNQLSIDFLSRAFLHRLKHATYRNELLAKAVGIKANYFPSVIDATAGLGRDAFLLAYLGCEVTMIERSEKIASLLRNALERLKVADGTSAFAEDNGKELIENDAIKKLKLILVQADAKDYLTALNTPVDVIYLDPMHPPRTKTALVKKEMRLLREIVGDDPDAAELLQIALQCARKRVVVKRPRLAPPLSGLKPNFVIMGKQQRFDVYKTNK